MHPDHHPYFYYTPKSRLEKTINTLAGIVEGITIDKAASPAELAFLKAWLDENDAVQNRHPFNELIPFVKEVIGDGVLSEDEKEDILWLCRRLSPREGFFKQSTTDMQKLHGIVGGILADGRITEIELRGLSQWLSDHGHLKTIWPYDEIDALVTSIMSDGGISEEEQGILQMAFLDFTTVEDDRTITNPPILEKQKLSGICAVCPDIFFEGSCFCFTGASARYSRKELAGVVESLGGTFSQNINKGVNYLIIGAEGNPCWAYACYGRKVEAAINLRKQGHKIVLAHENDFHDAVADHG